jgi:hypothetical protein
MDEKSRGESVKNKISNDSFLIDVFFGAFSNQSGNDDHIKYCKNRVAYHKA